MNPGAPFTSQGSTTADRIDARGRGPSRPTRCTAAIAATAGTAASSDRWATRARRPVWAPVLWWVALTLVPLGTRPLNGGAQVDPGTAALVSISDPVLAFEHALLIDGTGAPAARGSTVVLEGGRIVAVGPDGTVPVPDAARVVDLSGKTLLPGFVMLHEHMFYPAGGSGMYNELGWSFPRLYLGGGVTTLRTGGSMMPYADLNLARLIESGAIPGPDMDVTGPYLNGPGLPIPGVKALDGTADARRMVRYWADEGVTSFKAYMHISRDELAAAVDEAHARGLKVTGHLCSVTYREAADLGIDNLEHGFLAASDFVADKAPDVCPAGGAVQSSLLDVPLGGPAFAGLVRHLVDRGVAVTSTMTVFETFTPGRPRAPDGALDAMSVEARDAYLRARSQIAVQDGSAWSALFGRAMAMDKAFADAGGLLVVGTDPTGYGGVVAGYANQRILELLVEGGFTVEGAVEVATLNGARYLDRQEDIGSIATGKRADLIVVAGDLTQDVAHIRSTELVFKNGIGYDSQALFDLVQGTVGIR